MLPGVKKTGEGLIGHLLLGTPSDPVKDFAIALWHENIDV